MKQYDLLNGIVTVASFLIAVVGSCAAGIAVYGLFPHPGWGAFIVALGVIGLIFETVYYLTKLMIALWVAFAALCVVAVMGLVGGPLRNAMHYLKRVDEADYEELPGPYLVTRAMTFSMVCESLKGKKIRFAAFEGGHLVRVPLEGVSFRPTVMVHKDDAVRLREYLRLIKQAA